MSKVKCLYCNQYFDWAKEPYMKIGKRYSHEECAKLQDQNKIQEEIAKDELFKYLKEDLKYEYNYMAVNSTLNKYIKDYNYTYREMLNALKWFYEIKKNRIDKERGIVGIIPHIYDTAMEYYRNREQIVSNNEKISDSDFEVKTIEVNIFSPVPKLKKPKLFDME